MGHSMWGGIKIIKIEILHRIGERVWESDCRIGTKIIRSYFPIVRDVFATRAENVKTSQIFP